MYCIKSPSISNYNHNSKSFFLYLKPCNFNRAKRGIKPWEQWWIVMFVFQTIRQKELYEWSLRHITQVIWLMSSNHALQGKSTLTDAAFNITCNSLTSAWFKIYLYSLLLLILTCQKLNHLVGLQQGHWQLFHPKTESLPKKQRFTATKMMSNNGRTF